jgi:hypothetical protein
MHWILVSWFNEYKSINTTKVFITSFCIVFFVVMCLLYQNTRFWQYKIKVLQRGSGLLL